MDRSRCEVVDLGAEADDLAYWLARSPRERMQALELQRQIIYGYDPATARLQRVLTVAELQ